MKILLVIADLGIGGAQSIVVTLANGLFQQGDEVTVLDIYPLLRKNDIIKRLHPGIIVANLKINVLENAYIKIIDSLLFRTRLNKKFRENYLNNKQIRTLRNIISGNKADIINSHVWWADKAVYDAVGNDKKPWVITLHGSYDHLLNLAKAKEWFAKQAREVIEHVPGIITISDKNLELLSVLSPKKIYSKKIYNGYLQPESIKLEENLREKYDIEKSDFVYFIASRAIFEKGWREAIMATISLKNKGFAVQLMLAGDGPAYKPLYEEFGNYPFIHFLGTQKSVESILNISDVALLPSYAEQLPTFIIESLFAEKPVIATDISEVSQMLDTENGLCGIVFPLNESGTVDIPTLEKCMEKYLVDKELYKKHVACTKSASLKFDLKRFVDGYKFFYSEIINFVK